MGKLKEYLSQPNVTIGGREFVDKKLFIELFEERLREEKKDCDSAGQKDGIDICRNILANWK